MTNKQKIYAVYLLRQIGFVNEKKIESYLNKLEAIYGRYFEVQESHTYKSGYTSYYTTFKYSASDCIEELIKETEIKKDIWKIKPQFNEEKSLNSATDLSNFCFCPTSYSISNSFLIEHPTQEDKRLTGIKLHETLRLLNKRLPENLSENDVVELHIVENPTIEKIKKCKVVFCGHKEETEYFINEEESYIGQPDYIFEDPNGKKFVVEEKFRYLGNWMVDKDTYDGEKILKQRKLAKSSFYPNHLVQIQSYLKYIEKFKLDYGILLYWFYDFNGNYPMIHSFNFKVIKQEDNVDLLYQTVKQLEDFKKNKRIDFDTNTNPIKCAACVVNKYCIHKTGEFSNLCLPYQRKDLKLKSVEFPEELRKNKNQ